MDNVVRYFEVEFEDGYSICIKSRRKPTIAEANKWCAADVVQFGTVTNVLALDEYEAHTFFDCENEDEWPVFG